eukprot:m.815882 g.815882  ORF g.815882 m.815882 type:complete len:754 (-) comp59379_c0_seq1:226-2487(-)
MDVALTLGRHRTELPFAPAPNAYTHVEDSSVRQMQEVVEQLPSVMMHTRSRPDLLAGTSATDLLGQRTGGVATLTDWDGQVNDDFLRVYPEYCASRPHLNGMKQPCHCWPLSVKHQTTTASAKRIKFVDTHRSEQLHQRSMATIMKMHTANHRRKKADEFYVEPTDDEDAALLSAARRQATMTSFQMFRHDAHVRWKQTRERAWDAIKHFEIFEGTMRDIEGRFGTDLANYFRFSRKLIKLNLVLAILWIVFVIVPQSINGSARDSGISFTDIFTGGGFMNETIMYMGAYSDSASTSSYEIPMAYLVITGVTFLYSCILILIGMSKRFSQKVFTEDSRVPMPFSELLFHAWDFAIAEKKAASTKMVTVIKAAREILADTQRHAQKMSNQELLRQKLTRIVIHFVITVFIALGLYTIYIVATEFNQSKSASGIEQLLPSIIVTALNTCLPIFFFKLGGFEKRSKLYAARWLIMRSYLLRIASPVPILIRVFKDAHSDPSLCWTSDLGIEIYKLMLSNMVFCIVTTLMADGMRAFISSRTTPPERAAAAGFRPTVFDKIRGLVGPPQFGMSKANLDVLFNMGLIWLGVFFAPMLAVVGFISSILIFLGKYGSMRLFLEPYTEEYRAARTDSFNLVLLLITMIAAGLPVAYSFVSMPAPLTCGPFRASSGTPYDSMFDFVTEKVNNAPTVLSSILHYLATAGFVIPLFAALCLICYYYYALNSTALEYIKKIHLELLEVGFIPLFLGLSVGFSIFA